MKHRITVLICCVLLGGQLKAQEASVEVAMNRIVAHINSLHDQSNEANIAILGFKLSKGKEIPKFNGYVINELTQKLQKTKRFKVLNQNIVNAVYNTSGTDVWKTTNEETFSQFNKEANLNLQIWGLVFGEVEDMDDSLAINLNLIFESHIAETYRVVFLADEISNKLLKKSNAVSSVAPNEKSSDTTTPITDSPLVHTDEKEKLAQPTKQEEIADTLPQPVAYQTIGNLKIGVFAAERMGTELHIEVRVYKNGEDGEMPYVSAWFTNQKGKRFDKQFNTLTYRKLFADKYIHANVRFVDNTKKVKSIKTLTFDLEGVGEVVFTDLEVF